MPIVSKCEVTLQIWGTPEITAIRLRNEEDAAYSKWCPWTPKIGDYYTEINHTLSFDSGPKEICVQFMTYNGITMESCVPVIADYKKIVFKLQMFADIDRQIPLPIYNNSYVASITDKDGVTLPVKRTIYINIIPNNQVNATKINFDVLQQGNGDQLDLEAVQIDNEQIFKGQFTIYLEDNISNLDGIARIRAKLPGSCEKITEGFVTANFTREKFNLMSDNSRSSVLDSVDDNLSSYRQIVSGRIGVDITLRPSSDPYLIFGDPDYFLQRKDSEQDGVNSDEIFNVNSNDNNNGSNDNNGNDDSTTDPNNDPEGSNTDL